MSEPILGPDQIVRLRAVQIRAWTTPRLSVGGDTWTIRTTAGDGITGPGGTTTRTITGYIAQERAAMVVLTPGQQPVAPRRWRLSLITGTVAVGEELTSAADPTIQFRVTGFDQNVLFEQALVERI